MVAERASIACRFVRSPFMIAEQQAPKLGLRCGFGDRGLDPLIFGFDFRKDRRVELPRKLQPVADRRDTRDDFAVRRSFGDGEEQVSEPVGIGLVGRHRGCKAFGRGRDGGERPAPEARRGDRVRLP